MSFTKACSVSELPEPGELIGVEVDQEPVAIIRDADGNLHAINDICTHQYVKMSDGDDAIDGCEIECWLHAAKFNFVTGAATAMPGIDPVAVYPIMIDGDDVLINIAEPKTVKE